MVSVIIPCFNASKTIRYALLSLENQTNKDFEVICVDDGSEDNTVEVINEYIAQSKIKITLYNQHNYGVSKARNVGIINSVGEYICFLDADDQYYPQFIQEMLHYFNNQTDIVCSKYMQRNEYNLFECDVDVHKVDKLNHFQMIELYKHKRLTKINFFTCCYKKNIIIENNLFFPEDLSYGEDSEFICKYLYHCSNCVMIDNYLYLYKINMNSTMHKISYRRCDTIAAFRNIVEYWKKQGGSLYCGDYMIARAVWAVLKDFAIYDKVMYKKFVKSNNYRKYMVYMVRNADEFKIKLSSLFFLFHPIFFRFVVIAGNKI